MKLYFDDVAFDGALQRSVGKADAGMANVGECLAIAAQITAGDRDSWYDAWSGFGGRLIARGDEARLTGHRVSARNAYLRAADTSAGPSSFTAKTSIPRICAAPTRRVLLRFGPRWSCSNARVGC